MWAHHKRPTNYKRRIIIASLRVVTIKSGLYSLSPKGRHFIWQTLEQEFFRQFYDIHRRVGMLELIRTKQQ